MDSRRSLPLNFFDFLIVLLVGLLALTVVKRQETAEAGVSPKAEFLVELTWPDESASDIDLWFREPAGNVLFFASKQFSVYSLDRDDLGRSNDTMTMPDGTTHTILVNREILTMRGWSPSGRYTINVHVYRWNERAPIEATVRIIRLNPFDIALERKVALRTNGQEVTVASFGIDKDGRLINIDHGFVSLIHARRS